MSSSARTRHGARWVVLAAIVCLALAGSYWWTHRPEAPRFITAEVTRGPIIRSVTATGTVNPVTVVQVGTYVSGPIVAIPTDFNASVKAGQLIAKIDPRPFAAQVDLNKAALANARAQLLKDQANLVYQKITYQRDQVLRRQTVISQDQLDSQFSTYNQAVAQIALDQAAIQQQKANLHAAELNLHYTNIISPVNGTVVSVNVAVGQTVAASYQTPTLFLVAKDLTKMQVDSNVSESDVGNVRVGQPVDFTVDAYINRVFKGTVTQIRQAPITVQNVVTYDVVIGVANPELLLMPGMTANATIVEARRENVLRVPLRALSFSPRHHASATADEDAAAPASQHSARVWVLNNGRPHPVQIVRGLDDGTNVEVISGGLKEGEEVITDRIRTNGEFSSSPLADRHFHMHF
ncbi:MAG TPA: efflux RND transporter periplasmic adaptor subunit [Candidatus Binataceae bacterium]|nr:efflux RND transporter periplasmic adaptor subunit [Candidatus Binataceae bacterium]